MRRRFADGAFPAPPAGGRSCPARMDAVRVVERTAPQTAASTSPLAELAMDHGGKSRCGAGRELFLTATVDVLRGCGGDHFGGARGSFGRRRPTRSGGRRHRRGRPSGRASQPGRREEAAFRLQASQGHSSRSTSWQSESDKTVFGRAHGRRGSSPRRVSGIAGAYLLYGRRGGTRPATRTSAREANGRGHAAAAATLGVLGELHAASVPR
jgi:hypothetical protein